MVGKMVGKEDREKLVEELKRCGIFSGSKPGDTVIQSVLMIPSNKLRISTLPLFNPYLLKMFFEGCWGQILRLHLKRK